MIQSNEIIGLLNNISDYFEEKKEFTPDEEIFLYEMVKFELLNQGRINTELMLKRLKKYFERRSDAAFNQSAEGSGNSIDGNYVPNKEMKLLSKIDEVLQKIKK